MDELQQRVAEDHLAGADGDVAADLERLPIGLAHAERAVAALHVLRQMRGAAHQVLARAVESRAHQLRVGGDEIGRRGRAGDLAQVEARLGLGRRLDAGGAVDQGIGPVGAERMGLAQEIEHRQGFPFRRRKAFVARGERHDRLGVLALEAAVGLRPELEKRRGDRGLRFGQARGIAHPMFGDLSDGACRGDDRVRGVVAFGLAGLVGLEIGRERLGALLDEARHIGPELFEIRRARGGDRRRDQRIAIVIRRPR